MAQILVIDDDQIIREILITTLGEEGHTITAASDGWEGMKKFRPFVHQLVITDVVMPQIDGTDLLRVLRREVPNIPVIVVTAHATQRKEPGKTTTLETLNELGATRVLTKPFTREALLTAVNEALATH